MGIDLLDLMFRLENRFGIKIPRQRTHDLLEQGNTADPPEGAWTDFRVSELVALVESLVAEQHPEIEQDVFAGVRMEIVACLQVEEQYVTPEAWLIRDLGME